jgi:hypothetical protein
MVNEGQVNGASPASIALISRAAGEFITDVPITLCDDGSWCNGDGPKLPRLAAKQEMATSS